MQKSTLNIAVLLSVGAITTSCGPTARNDNGSSPIAGTTWMVKRLANVPAPPARPPAATLRFDSHGRLTGRLACNRIGGSIMWLPEGAFAHQDAPMISTMMGCIGQKRGSAYGSRFWDQMHNARSWQRRADQLIVRFSDGSDAELQLDR